MPTSRTANTRRQEWARLEPEFGDTTSCDDAVFVEALCRRAPEAVAAFYDRYVRLVTRILVRILGRDPDLQDLHHEAFVRALGAIERLRDPACLTQWMTSVVVFTARTHLQRRHSKRWLMFLAPDDLPMEQSVSNGTPPEAREALRTAYRLMDRMPTDERILFTLRLVEGLELTELASICKISVATVKRRLIRAETRFAALARLEPTLREWVERGGRWSAS